MQIKSWHKTFRGYLHADLYRFVRSTNWIMASFGVAATLFFSYYSMFGSFSGMIDEDILFIYMAACEGTGSMLLYVFCAYSFGMSFSEDLEDGYCRYEIIRGNRRLYVLSHAMIIFLGAFLAMILGTVIFLLLCRSRVPWVNDQASTLNMLREGSSGYRFLWDNGHYMLYCMTEAFYMGLFAGTLSLMSASASLFVKNRALVLLLPVALLNLIIEIGLIQIGGLQWSFKDMQGIFVAAGDEWEEFLKISAVNIMLSGIAIFIINTRLKRII